MFGASAINLEQLGTVGLMFLVLSVIVEVALAPIFNWRVYLSRFDGASYINPLVFTITYVLIRSYNIDIAGALVQALTPATGAFVGSNVVSALLVTGGSQFVFRLFDLVGIRDLSARRQKAAETRAHRVNRAKKEE